MKLLMNRSKNGPRLLAVVISLMAVGFTILMQAQTSATASATESTAVPTKINPPSLTLYVGIYSGHRGSVNSVAFSPDGKYVLTGSSDNTARLWDAQSGQSIRAYSGHRGSVNSVAFSPDGKYILTGSSDNTARLWNIQSGRSILTYTGHTDIVKGVAFSPDGKYVLTGSLDNTARLWDAESGESIRTFPGGGTTVLAVAFSPDGNDVLIASGEAAQLWDIQSGQPIRTFNGDIGIVRSVAFSLDGSYVLAGGTDHTELLAGTHDTVQLWDIQSGQPIRTFLGHTDAVWSVMFSLDSKYVLTGSEDKTARLWESGIKQ